MPSAIGTRWCATWFVTQQWSRLISLECPEGGFPQDERGLFDSTHLHFYIWDGWVELFRRAGLRIDAVRPSCVPVGVAMPGLDGTATLRVLEWMSFETARVWKNLFAYQFIVRARKECT
jgi:hypothetical protein